MVKFIFFVEIYGWGNLAIPRLIFVYVEGIKLKLFITTVTLFPLDGASPLSNQRFMFAKTPAAFELSELLKE